MRRRCSQLIDIFEKSTEEHRAIIARSSLDLTKNGSRARVFDNFPTLLPDEEIKVFSEKLLALITRSSVVVTDTSYELKSADKEKISALLTQIAKIGCEALLNQSGSVNSYIMQSLGWDAPLSAAESEDILLAYTCAISQAIVVTPEFLEQRDILPQQNLIAVILFVNTEYGIAASKAIAEFTKEINAIKKTESKKRIGIESARSRSVFDFFGIPVGGVAYENPNAPAPIELQPMRRPVGN